MSSPTEIHFPETLPFPFKILSLAAHTGQPISGGQRLLNYSFLHVPSDSEEEPRTIFGSWDATFDGDLHAWKVKVGEVVTRQRARDRPALTIIEPCKHGMQINGLCALCGMDMEGFDYTGRAESSRATIQMTHSAGGPTVSLEEAQRIENETAQHLLRSRKLSLIVDLDQTIVHATVDPTVGEWIAEGEAWEERHAQRQAKAKAREEKEKEKAAKDKDGEDSDSSSDDTDNEAEGEEEDVNPNWEALKDVRRFRLAPDNFGAPTRIKNASGRHEKGMQIQIEGCLYYVKPRPGWQEFLSHVARKYELHVYTMGTRAYAEEVCAAIDGDGRIFGGRILSRDESGSLTQKSLRRLFPCDTSMVVIIDDRADVWEWSPNLVKVIPYEFFVGIGDINSAFLPKVDPLSQQPPTSPSPIPSARSPTPTPPPTTPPSAPSEDDADEDESEEAKSLRALAKSAMLSQNAIALEAQVEERPLAKKQEALDETDDEQPVNGTPAATTNGQPVYSSSSETGSEKHHHHKKALLNNDDHELVRVRNLLDEIHHKFFDAYDHRNAVGKTSKNVKFAQSSASDVKVIIPEMRTRTLAGVHILFSAVIPTNTPVGHEKTEVWRMATAFGATCHKDLTPEVTHVVTAKRGTQKVEKAQSQGNVFVVWFQWFADSVARWEKQDERAYLLDSKAAEAAEEELVGASSPPSDPLLGSSDTEDPEEIVGDDDDEGVGGGEDKPQREDAPTPGEGEEDVDRNLNLDDVNWQDVNDEVEAAMLESDSEEEQSNASGSRPGSGRNSGNGSDDEQSSSRSPRTPLRQKRSRSATPSEIDLNTADDSLLRSPLAKRKKLAADRTGLSRLKQGITAKDLHQDPGENARTGPLNASTSTQSNSTCDEESEMDDVEEEDDFLARELDEEWT